MSPTRITRNNNNEPPDDDLFDDMFEEEEEVWTAERLERATYKDLGTPNEVQERFLKHLLNSPSCRGAIQTLYTSEKSATCRDYSLEIDTFELVQSDTVLGCLLLKYPTTLLPLLEKGIVQAQHQLFGDSEQNATVQGTIKGDTAVSMTRVHARLVHLPPTCTKSSLNQMQARDVGKIWQVSGTVVRSSPVQMYESARTYQCCGTKKGCGRNFTIDADLERTHNALVEPDTCPLMSPTGQGLCGGTNLKVMASIHTDYQEIKIQEAASKIGMGHIPRSLLIKLQHDLIDRCQPGDQVVVVGSLLAQWPETLQPETDCPIGMALKAHSIRIVQEKGGSFWNEQDLTEMDRLRQEFDAYWQQPQARQNPIQARNYICKAVCPRLYGMAMVKLALLVTLIGGVPSSSEDDNNDNQENRGGTDNNEHDMEDDEPDQFQLPTWHSNSARGSSGAGFYDDDRSTSNSAQATRTNKAKSKAVVTRRRDQSHLLLVGDPGTAKSQFLRFAAALCPRSVLTTGVGTTSAGLTCAALREGSGKEFVLEAGALVLADKGVCCIDEFGCIRKEDRTTIHEAMEQQTLSVAKGGIVCKLNCRATIIAVMNPKDNLYDNHASLARNTGLGTPLLSRFDICFKLVDSSDASRDSNIATYLLNRAIAGTGFECVNTDENNEGTEEAPWSLDKLRAYISIVKTRFHPVVSDDAAQLLERHYEKCRSTESTTIPVTVRFLESMIRLSQAHARLMYRDTVTLDDAVAVVRIMECSAFAYGGFDANVPDLENALYLDPMTIEFSTNADLDFLAFQHKILERYGLLGRMSPPNRRKALEYMGGGPANSQANGWSEPWQVVPQSQPPAPAGRMHTEMHEDHYGRFHFSQRPRSSGEGTH